MTFEEWTRTQIDLRAVISVKLGQGDDGSCTSLMTWSDKKSGTWFWDVRGDRVSLTAFVGDEPNPAAVCRRCHVRRDRHPSAEVCVFNA